MARTHAVLLSAVIVVAGIVYHCVYRYSELGNGGGKLAIIAGYASLWTSAITMISGGSALEVAIAWTAIVMAAVADWGLGLGEKHGKRLYMQSVTPRPITVSRPRSDRFVASPAAIDGIWITVKYPSHCVRCRNVINAGERALWKKGVGIWHDRCARPYRATTSDDSTVTFRELSGWGFSHLNI